MRIIDNYTEFVNEKQVAVSKMNVNEIEKELNDIESKIDNLPKKKSVPGGGDAYSSSSKEGKFNRRIDVRYNNLIDRRNKLNDRLKKIEK